MEPIRVGIVGTGNYAWHLIQCFKANSLSIDVHFGRSTESFEGFIHPPETKQTHSLDDLSNCDLLFLCISDSSIKSLSNYWANHAALVIHVSGGLGITALHSKNKGVFYIPQSFTKGRNISYFGLPVCIEADTDENKSKLQQLAQKLQLEIHLLDSDQRRRLHLAAVMTNNFANYLFIQAEEWMQQYKIDPSILHPLMLETAKKAIDLGPKNAQTGPAIRGDMGTVKKHLRLIKNMKLKSLYRRITRDIFESREKKL